MVSNIFHIKTVFLILILFNVSLTAQNSRNPVLEMITGAWCPDCPCGEEEANQISQLHNDVIILSYHYLDDYSNNQVDSLIDLLNYRWLPSAIIDRAYFHSPFYFTIWDSLVTERENVAPTVSISMSGSFDSGNNHLNLSVDITALQNLQGEYFLNIFLTEDSLISSQNGSNECPGGENFIHNFVTRQSITNIKGDSLDSGAIWLMGGTISKSYSTSLSPILKLENCKIVSFVSKNGDSLAYHEIQQAVKKKFFSAVILSTSELSTSSRVPYTLNQNYPNPFNPSTKISYSIPNTSKVTLKVFDILGKEITTLVNDEKPVGNYNVEFDAAKLPSGIYFYQLKAGKFIQTKKMVLMK